MFPQPEGETGFIPKDETSFQLRIDLNDKFRAMI